MRILVVENHTDTLKYLKMYLERLGHSVTTACTMQAALAVIPTADCEVIVSDLGLPDGTGWELMEKAKFPKPVYAVAISGYAAENDIQRSMAAGFHRHIAKPFRGEELRQSLDDAAHEIKTWNPEIHFKKSRPPASKKKRASRKAMALTPVQIADRLHHDTCQNLVGAQLLLSVLRDSLPQDGGEVRELVEKVIGVLDDASVELVALMKELRTPPGMVSGKEPPAPPPL